MLAIDIKMLYIVLDHPQGILASVLGKKLKKPTFDIINRACRLSSLNVVSHTHFKNTEFESKDKYDSNITPTFDLITKGLVIDKSDLFRKKTYNEKKKKESDI